MPQRPTAKVIQFPGINRQATPANVLDALKAVLGTAEKSEVAPGASVDAASAVPSTVINGNAFHVIHGNVHVTNTYHVEKAASPAVIVQTGVGTIDAQQKQRLLELRDGVVLASNSGTKQKTPVAVMGALNRHMKVNKYDEILAVDFDKAVKWMVRQSAIKTGPRPAAAKSPQWRKLCIEAIHVHCKEQGFESWQMTYMMKKFRKFAMADLSDADLDTMYRAAMAKK